MSCLLTYRRRLNVCSARAMSISASHLHHPGQQFPRWSWVLVLCCLCLAASRPLQLRRWVMVLRNMLLLVLEMRRWSKASVSPSSSSLRLPRSLSAWYWWAVCGLSTSRRVSLTAVFTLFCFSQWLTVARLHCLVVGALGSQLDGCKFSY